jgi:hypothetical protein
MAENFDLRSKLAGSGQSGTAASGKWHGGARPPSIRSINGLLDWIAEAQTVRGTWVGHFLTVVGVIWTLLLLASGLGLLPR